MRLSSQHVTQHLHTPRCLSSSNVNAAKNKCQMLENRPESGKWITDNSPDNRGAALALRPGLQSSDTGSCTQSPSPAAPRDVVNAISLQQFHYSETPRTTGIRCSPFAPRRINRFTATMRKASSANVLERKSQPLISKDSREPPHPQMSCDNCD